MERQDKNHTFKMVTIAGSDQTIHKRSTPISSFFTTKEGVPGSLSSFEPIDVKPNLITFQVNFFCILLKYFSKLINNFYFLFSGPCPTCWPTAPSRATPSSGGPSPWPPSPSSPRTPRTSSTSTRAPSPSGSARTTSVTRTARCWAEGELISIKKKHLIYQMKSVCDISCH